MKNYFFLLLFKNELFIYYILYRLHKQIYFWLKITLKSNLDLYKELHNLLHFVFIKLK
jgi:hypothetical protein